MTASAPSDAPPPDAPADGVGLLRAMRRRLTAAPAAVPPVDALPIDRLLRQAAARADVGTALPPLAHLGRLRRGAAAAAGRVLLYFLRLLSLDQSRFNHLIVRALAAVSSQAAGQQHALAAVQATAGAHSAAAARGLAAAQADAAARLAALESALLVRLDESAAHLAAVREEQALLQRGVEELRSSTTWLRTQTDVLRRRVAAPAPPASAAAVPSEAAALATPPPASSGLDAWMAAAAFRGDEAVLRDGQRRYVELFAGRRDVLDIGCGRGVFLELLRDAGVPATGVDADRDMALWCREKGLAVTCADALAHLAQTPAASLGGIFCAQVVEHLATPDMLRLIELAVRALRPDGLLVIETLNPESLLVLYRWFWVDLTHQRLVHPQTLRVIVEAAGLRQIEVRHVPPPPGALRLPVLTLPGVEAADLAAFNDATRYLNDLLFGSFDYAIIGVR